VSLDCKYQKPLRYGDKVLVETTFHDTKAAKINFEYKLFHLPSGDLVATGHSMQVFLDSKTNSLLLNNPPFFEAWKNEHGLLV
jgi:acyl-CoA thioester hydrolase